MSSLLKDRGGVLLAGARPPSEETADGWMIRLRWVAVLGMAVTTLIAWRLVPGMPVVRLYVAVAGIAALNVFWTFWVRRAPAGSSPYVGTQIVVDVVALSVVLWLSGGVGNPFAVFLTFQIVLAGLLTSGGTTLSVAALTLMAVAVLSFAAPLDLSTARMGEARAEHLADLMAVAALSAFSGFFIFVFTQRLAELRQDSERNAKLAMLGRLVGGMSHELNTPLATILLASKDLVLVGKESQLAEVAELAQTVAGEAQRAADIIALLRGTMRPGVADEPVDVAALVVAESQRELDRLGFTGARLISAPGPVMHPLMRAGFLQVLKNLLTNAVEATRGQPPGRIEIDVREHLREGTIEIRVRDDGPGIRPDLLDRLGEPFSTTKEAQGGMGLGLYLSGLLAERMGGALQVDLPEGGGTRVTLSLTRPELQP